MMINQSIKFLWRLSLQNWERERSLKRLSTPVFSPFITKIYFKIILSQKWFLRVFVSQDFISRQICNLFQFSAGHKSLRRNVVWNAALLSTFSVYVTKSLQIDWLSDVNSMSCQLPVVSRNMRKVNSQKSPVMGLREVC